MRTIKTLFAIILLAGLIGWVSTRVGDSSSKPLVPHGTGVDSAHEQRGGLLPPLAIGGDSQRTRSSATEETEFGGNSETPGSTPVELRSIAVQVVDDLDTPLGGVRVWIEGADAESQAVTSQMGDCSVRFPVNSQKPILRAQADGHLSEWQAIRPEQSEARLLLPRMRDVFGYVVRAHDGQPVVEASVLPAFYGGSPEDAALVPITTDAAGRFGPLSVPIGRMFILRVERDGFRSVGKRVTVGNLDSDNLPAIGLELARRVRFHVFEAESGQPIEGAELVAMGGVKESARTDDRGIGLLERIFAESDVERGVRIRAAGRCAVIARLTGDLVATDSEIQIPLHAECFVKGRTLDKAGKVVGGVQLRATFDLGEGVRLQRNPEFPNKQLVPDWPGYVEWDPGDWVLESTSDEDGNYSIGNLVPGLVSVGVLTSTSHVEDPAEFVVPGPRVPGETSWLDVVIE
ncbi:MAG: hypothetical protein H6831_12415 [Planctomycetes bacterium]|nr:hypothetical protein [Planctomycetota bacterium]